MSVSRLPVTKSATAVASDHVNVAFDRIRNARKRYDERVREAEADRREEISANLRIVIDARRSHLKLSSLFKDARTSGLALDTAVEIEDGTRTDEREVGIYVRTVSEALVARSASHQ